MRQQLRKGLARGAEVGVADYVEDAGTRQCAGYVYPPKHGGRMTASQQRDMQHAG